MRPAAKTAAMMAVLTLGMKILGFLREVFMAGFFGTSYIIDAYVMQASFRALFSPGSLLPSAHLTCPFFQIVEDRGIDEGNDYK